MENKVDLTIMLKLLYCLVRSLKKPGDTKTPTVRIDKRIVDEKVPDDWTEQMKIQPAIIDGVECYLIHMKHEPEPTIWTPDERIKT